MFGLTDHIKNLDPSGRSYQDGRKAMRDEIPITNCPIYGTCWDQANWLAGWMDQLAEMVHDIHRKTTP